MKKLIMFFALITLASCNNGKSFAYNKSTACEIRYGNEGIAVIVDGNRALVKNTSQYSFGKILEVRTADRKYSTLGRYFDENESAAMVQSLSRSKVIYYRWVSPSGADSIGAPRQGMAYTSDFNERFDACVKQQSNL
jgi:hypothetical protein